MMRKAFVLAGAALLAGCQTLSPDGGMSVVQEIVRTELAADVERVVAPEDVASAAARTDALLARPLGPDAAVQVALLSNRGLQASYAALGVAEADFVQASLPPNPRVGLARLVTSGTLEIERRIVASLFALATLPERTAIARDRFRAAQLEAARATFALAAETRRQYFRTVAANQLVTFLSDARETAKAASELLVGLGETGGATRLAQAREHAFYAETSAQLARARLQQRIEREKLTRLLGLWGEDVAFRLPDRLPELPGHIHARGDVEGEAVAKRLDLRIGRLELEALGRSLGLADATRLVQDLDLVGIANTERSRTVEDGEIEKEVDQWRGFEVEFEIPIFDTGAARVARAEAAVLQAANALQQNAIEARSQAREAYQTYRGTYEVARLYQDQVLPLRQVIEEEQLLQYNAMIADVTDFVADARLRILSNAQAIEARRDFFIAETDLGFALVGGFEGGAAVGGAVVAEAGGGAAPH
jgi:outer membrane protein TolC